MSELYRRPRKFEDEPELLATPGEIEQVNARICGLRDRSRKATGSEMFLKGVSQTGSGTTFFLRLQARQGVSESVTVTYQELPKYVGASTGLAIRRSVSWECTEGKEAQVSDMYEVIDDNNDVVPPDPDTILSDPFELKITLSQVALIEEALDYFRLNQNKLPS